MTSQAPIITLNNGVQIPQLGLGLWQMYLKWTCKAAVKSALKNGYRHFDTAQVYFNEQHLGAALRESNINREDIFITTKIRRSNFGANDLIPSFAKSLKKLRIAYADLLLLHFPVPELRQAAWKEMEKLYDDGKAKSIGVSNYTIKHLEELLASCSIKPVLNQVELHVFLQQPELVEYCKAHDIVVEAYSPLAHGQALDNPTLQKIARKHQKTAAQIMLRWLIEQGFVVIPKSANPERIRQNFDVFDFKLDSSDKEQIIGLNKGLRTCWDPTNTA